MDKILKAIRNYIYISLFYIFRIFSIKNNKIVCLNFNGKGYGDSPKYITKELDNSYKIIWLIDKNANVENIPNISFVKNNKLNYIFHLTTARIWINNSRFPNYVRKRKKQVYFQTWHGGLALKKIEYDAYNSLTYEYKKAIKNDNRMINYLLSNSNFCTNMYINSFKYKGNIIEVGTPRNDILMTKNTEIKEKVYHFFNISPKKNILLYAPTFRKSYEFNPYDIDFDKLKNVLEKKESNWEILIKLHPNVKNSDVRIKGKYINASNYSDIQELIIASDLLITDYSSTMFEAMIADKPVILYANDIKRYANDRGYYFLFEELPFKIVKNNDELKKLIEGVNLDSLKDGYGEFKERVGLKENGTASLSVANMIEFIVKQNQERKNV